MRASWQDPSEPRGASFGMPTLTRAVRALLIANIALFVLQWVVLEGWFQPAFQFTEDAFALNPLQWRDHFPLVPLWQLVSYAFLHGGPSHLLYNMLFLYFMGTMLEERLGSERFLFFYLVASVLAGACQLVLGLALGQVAPIVGASGGVLAIVFAMATLEPYMRVIFLIVPVTLRTLALIYGSLVLFDAIMDLKGATNNVANFAHLTGALFGFLAVRGGWIWHDPLAQVGEWRVRRARARADADRERMESLLAKISRVGIHELSERERTFMKRYSQRR